MFLYPVFIHLDSAKAGNCVRVKYFSVLCSKNTELLLDRNINLGPKKQEKAENYCSFALLFSYFGNI